MNLNHQSKEPTPDTRRRIMLAILRMLGQSMPPSCQIEFLEVPPVPEPRIVNHKFLVQVQFPEEALLCDCPTCRDFLKERLQYLTSEAPALLKAGFLPQITIAKEP